MVAGSSRRSSQLFAASCWVRGDKSLDLPRRACGRSAKALWRPCQVRGGGRRCVTWVDGAEAAGGVGERASGAPDCEVSGELPAGKILQTRQSRSTLCARYIGEILRKMCPRHTHREVTGTTLHSFSFLGATQAESRT